MQLDSHKQNFSILKASSGTINLSRKKYQKSNEKSSTDNKSLHRL